jgi:hypothetical protein
MISADAVDQYGRFLPLDCRPAKGNTSRLLYAGLLAATLCSSVVADGGAIKFIRPSVNEGRIALALSYSPGSESGAALQLDFTYDASSLVVVEVSPGSALGNNKTLAFSFPSAGGLRVLVLGVNRDGVPAGEIVVLGLRPKLGHPLGSLEVKALAASSTGPELQLSQCCDQIDLAGIDVRLISPANETDRAEPAAASFNALFGTRR